MQVGVEEAVAVDHPDDRGGAEVDQFLSGFPRQRLRLGSVGPQAVDELHAQHPRPGQLGVHRREDDAGQVQEVRRERLDVVGFLPQVHLALRVVHELVDDAPRLVAREHPLEDRAERAEQAGIAAQGFGNPGLHHLDDHGIAGQGGSAVDLGDRRRPERLRVDGQEQLREGPAEIALHQLAKRSNGTTGSRSSRFFSSSVIGRGSRSSRRLRIWPSLM